MLAEPKSSVIRGDRKHIISKFTDGSEVEEEYDVVSDQLLLRKRRSRNTLGGYTDWVIEVGTEEPSRNLDRALIVEASGSPVLVRQDTTESYVIRIRNLPYPREVYAVTVERQEGDAIGKIVVRTSNKKYFKRLDIPDMERAGLPLDGTSLSHDVQHQTLVLQYRKPLSVLTVEAAARKERAAMVSKRADANNADCKQQ